jgi:hypothetical protein
MLLLNPGLAGIQQFLQGQFDQLRQQFNARFDEQQAMMYNIRIVSHNQRDIHSPHRPLQKYVSQHLTSCSARTSPLARFQAMEMPWQRPLLSMLL